MVWSAFSGSNSGNVEVRGRYLDSALERTAEAREVLGELHRGLEEAGLSSRLRVQTQLEDPVLSFWELVVFFIGRRKLKRCRARAQAALADARRAVDFLE